MHETSLNQTIIDYITGDEIHDTTFEDLRQAIARILVEQRGYPRERLRTKEVLSYDIDGEHFEKVLDLVAFDPREKPLLLVMFCPGGLVSYIRQYVAAARLFAAGPIPFLVVTDSKEAKLVRCSDGEILKEGFHAFPTWEELLELSKAHTVEKPDQDRVLKEQRILYAMHDLSGPCCKGEC
ncbi:type I restriction enzyme HsdR N-terminal domain-containing protein [Desulfoplanes sp. PS50]